MSNYNNLKLKKTSELRTLLSKQIDEGHIDLFGRQPKSIKRYVSLMRKADLIHCLDNACIQFDKQSESEHGAEIFKKACDKNFGRKSQSKADANKSASSQDIMQSLNKLRADAEANAGIKKPAKKADANKPAVDYQLVTDKGMKQLDEVVKDMNIETVQVGDGVSDLLNHLASRVIEAESQVNKLVSMKPVKIELNGKLICDPEKHYHPKFEQIVKYAKLDGNVMLVGEAGTGKTTTAEQVAEALNLDFDSISCTMGMSESMLLGRPTINGGYISTRFVEIFENGGVFLFDEFDALDSNMFCVINSALANGKLSIPYRPEKPQAKRHKDCIIIACGNTWGTGQGSRMYNGRNAIDGATLDRFTNVKFDYDVGLERKLVGEHQNAFALLQELRARVQSKNIQRIVSTRAFVKANKHLSNGVTLAEFVSTLTESWTTRELEKLELDNLVKANS